MTAFPVTVTMMRPMAPQFGVFGELNAEGNVVVIATGDIEMAAGYLKMMTPAWRMTEPRGGMQAPISWSLVCQLGALGKSWVPGPKLTAWATAEVGRRMVDNDPLTTTRTEAPPPRDYQWEGAQVIARTGKCLIFDEPGTGKTLTTLLGLSELRLRGMIPAAAPIIVICPNSVMDAWVDAVHTWIPGWTAKAWRGPAEKRRRLVDSRHDVYVVGYAVARRDADPHERHAPLYKLGAGAVVIDECHQIKSPNALQSKAVRKLCASVPAVIALSGTPITHSSADLWPTLNALDAKAWPSRERYVGRYLDVMAGDYSEAVLGLNKANEPEFRMALLGAHRRLSKADVLSQLPPKVYSVRYVTLPPAARKAYDDLKKDMLAQLDNGDELPAMSVLSQLTHLRQLATAYGNVLITYTTELDEFGTEFEKQHVHIDLVDEPGRESWKVDEVIEILDERPGQQVVVFDPSAQMTRLSAARAAKQGYRVGLVIGGQSAKERTASIDAFQAGDLDVLCVSTAAGGVGITLTAASTVIFTNRPWSYVEASQAEDRCHRIGSERHDSIEIIDVVASNSVDSDVRETLHGKAGSLAELLQDPRIVEQCLGGRTTTKG